MKCVAGWHKIETQERFCSHEVEHEFLKLVQLNEMKKPPPNHL